MIFRCTQKVRDALGLSKGELLNSTDHAEDLAEWYCNLLRIDRRKLLLFTQASTLYSFLVPGIRQPDLENFGDLFRSHLARNLERQGFSADQAEFLLNSGPDHFAKAHDRSVLGSMNDHARMCKLHVEYYGGFERIDFVDLNRRLNSTPMSRIGMRHASMALREILEAAGSA